jgi:hypothetical protein
MQNTAYGNIQKMSLLSIYTQKWLIKSNTTIKKLSYSNNNILLEGRYTMIKTLIKLANILDKYNEKEAADTIDLFIKDATDYEDDDPINEWKDEITKVEAPIRSLPEFDRSMLEYAQSLAPRDLTAQLKHIFERAGSDPLSWDKETKEKTRHLMKKLQEVL